ncbi:metallophosphoesterase [Propionibacterium sp.]|uniref:metallophosphoesterase n=1 Tax=Propionibacterium sp. TaxID=1977903 RepID=UPI0039E916CB
MASLRILHIGDTHLRGDGGLTVDGVDPNPTLHAALEILENVGPIDLLAVVGDVSDDGSVASYDHAREMLGGFAARHGRDGAAAAMVLVPGNHDRRPGFHQVLGNGHFPFGEVTDAHPDDRPAYGISTAGDFRIVTLDSSVPGRSHGVVDSEQLDWLADVLSTDSGAGTVLVVHHPPVAPVTPIHQDIGLLNASKLAAVVGRSDVQVILSGHYHHALMESMAGRRGRIPVLVSAGIINQNQVLAPAGSELALAASGANLVELDVADQTIGTIDETSGRQAHIRVLPLTLTPAATLTSLSPEQVEALSERIGATPQERAAAES